MAISNNILLKGFSGHIDKIIVVKQYPGNRTIVTAYPDMSKVKPIAAQLAAKKRFGLAVAYAKNIRAQANLEAQAETRLANRQGGLYQALIKEFMQKDPADG